MLEQTSYLSYAILAMMLFGMILFPLMMISAFRTSTKTRTSVTTTVTCKKCNIKMHANSIKAIEVIAESTCKQPECPCKAVVPPILLLPPPDMAKLTKKERKRALRTQEFEERLATIARAARKVNGSNVTYLPPPPPRIKEPQVYLEFDAPISEHMMT